LTNVFGVSLEEAAGAGTQLLPANQTMLDGLLPQNTNPRLKGSRINRD
jgi:hypothetical protein